MQTRCLHFTKDYACQAEKQDKMCVCGTWTYGYKLLANWKRYIYQWKRNYSMVRWFDIYYSIEKQALYSGGSNVHSNL